MDITSTKISLNSINDRLNMITDTLKSLNDVDSVERDFMVQLVEMSYDTTLINFMSLNPFDFFDNGDLRDTYTKCRIMLNDITKHLQMLQKMTC